MKSTCFFWYTYFLFAQKHNYCIFDGTPLFLNTCSVLKPLLCIIIPRRRLETRIRNCDVKTRHQVSRFSLCFVISTPCGERCVTYGCKDHKERTVVNRNKANLSLFFTSQLRILVRVVLYPTGRKISSFYRAKKRRKSFFQKIFSISVQQHCKVWIDQENKKKFCYIHLKLFNHLINKKQYLQQLQTILH